MSKGLLIVRCKAALSEENYESLQEILLREKEEGVVVLPPFLEAIYVPEDIEIEFESLK